MKENREEIIGTLNLPQKVFAPTIGHMPHARPITIAPSLRDRGVVNKIDKNILDPRSIHLEPN